MFYEDLPYDMSEEEVRPLEPSVRELSLEHDLYMEEIIECVDCGREGPRYEIEGHSCGEADKEAA